MESSKFLSIFIPVFVMIMKTAFAGEYVCSNTTSFAQGSQYETNLYNLFKFLTANATNNPSGYYQAVAGKTSNEAIYGAFLCGGDQTASSCQKCVTTATTDDLPNNCPNRKEAVMWYDECMVRYSNHSFFGKMEIQPRKWIINGYNVTGNMTQFQQLVGNMMNNVFATAASRSQKKFAMGSANFTLFISVYGSGQCTPDLSPGQCNECLKSGFESTTYSKGARIYLPSCKLRYEIYSLPPPVVTSQLPSNYSIHSSGNLYAGMKKSVKVSLAIVFPVAAVLVALLVFVIFRIKRRKQYDAVVENGEDFTNAGSLQYDLATLQSATNDFSDENKLGEGGFGCVYKATKSNGQQVAVKRLSRTSNQGIQEFKTEVFLVAKLQHRNLVKLLGFCFEGQEKLLVYEYVPNKSLDKFLFDADDQRLLSWEVRYNLIRGIARGMLYLHHDSQPRIIHRDLKASNVLVDANMNPKISDFGMARIFGVDQSKANTSRVVGTFGYMSPEYAMHGQLSIKSDVYSFGVLVLEIISGKRNTTFYQYSDAEDLLSYSWKQWINGMFLDIIDPAIRGSCSNDEVMRCIQLALVCVQESPDDRPTMETVVLTLDSYSIALPIPDVPGFFIKSKRDTKHTNEFGSADQSSSKSIHWSTNDVSVTDPEPR